jgi:6-pyruvoyl-tetrahydropterin synthase
MNVEKSLSAEIQEAIIKLRKEKDIQNNWIEFRNLVEQNIDEVCSTLDTRWLISICDTYVDFGDNIIRRNAMLVVQIPNFEKLWATHLLMYDVSLNPEKLQKLKNNKIIALWDGMYSFNLNHGDLTNNQFDRLEKLLKETPVIEQIYRTVIQRIKDNDTVLANLNKYHGRLFEPDRKRSLFRILRKKILYLLRSYKI